jgi:protein arginine kinase
MEKWYQKADSIYPGVIISSRVRLARNLKKYPFPSRLNSENAKELVDEIGNVFKNEAVLDTNFTMLHMNNVPSIDKVAMMEQHTISPMFINTQIPNAVLLSEDDSVSIMINEEDHLRIQAMSYGADLLSAFNKANTLDDFIEKSVDFAFDHELGYLTSCPTNIGTGLRASYMLHVPALEATGQLRIILDAIGKFGITFRGIYGESSEPIGSVFQVSNQVTLGFSEKEIIDNLNSVTMQIVDQELAVREKLMTEKRLQFEDSIYRSYGILKHARILSSKEAMTLLSDIKLGIELGLLKTSNHGGINIFNLMTSIQPGNLQKLEKKSLDVTQRDIARANYIRAMIPDIQGG